ncbi:hypothetical protein M407DRAFT_120317 [Tulasnella calospora MUT 4182]|uniref:Uncharacterized protein n=1 Tax=Tulasnella calospora MUT 4182 TaxID=1051891 RepID=A0A0C3QAV1_9AGAM|nr:hypothetical protein M407DRAFT_120317 [Tulasnella calospora MUT 4182]
MRRPRWQRVLRLRLAASARQPTLCTVQAWPRNHSQGFPTDPRSLDGQPLCMVPNSWEHDNDDQIPRLCVYFLL